MRLISAAAWSLFVFICDVFCQDVEKGSVRVADGTEAQDSVWSVRDQRYRDTQDSELSLTLLCYTDAQDHESTDQTSDCNAENSRCCRRR